MIICPTCGCTVVEGNEENITYMECDDCNYDLGGEG